MLTKFQKKVYNIVSQIPRGRVASYQDVAKRLGDKNLARAVGKALKHNPFAPKIPCHRIISKNGRLGGYKFGLKNKRKILIAEGIKFDEQNLIARRYFFKL